MGIFSLTKVKMFVIIWELWVEKRESLRESLSILLFVDRDLCRCKIYALDW